MDVVTILETFFKTHPQLVPVFLGGVGGFARVVLLFIIPQNNVPKKWWQVAIVYPLLYSVMGAIAGTLFVLFDRTLSVENGARVKAVAAGFAGLDILIFITHSVLSINVLSKRRESVQPAPTVDKLTIEQAIKDSKAFDKLLDKTIEDEAHKVRIRELQQDLHTCKAEVARLRRQLGVQGDHS